jgi:hypothetical protein
MIPRQARTMGHFGIGVGYLEPAFRALSTPAT